MIDTSVLVDKLVAALRDIPELVLELDGDALANQKRTVYLQVVPMTWNCLRNAPGERNGPHPHQGKHGLSLVEGRGKVSSCHYSQHILRFLGNTS